MTIGDGTRTAVEAAIEWIERRYGDVTVERHTEADPPERFEHGVEVAEAGKLAGAGAWVEDDDGRVLFVRHPNAPEDWGLPGGGVEPGETLAETAVREVSEETGVRAEVTDAWKVRHRTVHHAENPDRRFHVLDAWFEATAVAAAVDLDRTDWNEDEEVLEARWFASPPESVVGVFEDRVAEWASD